MSCWVNFPDSLQELRAASVPHFVDSNDEESVSTLVTTFDRYGDDRVTRVCVVFEQDAIRCPVLIGHGKRAG